MDQIFDRSCFNMYYESVLLKLKSVPNTVEQKRKKNCKIPIKKYNN